MASASEDLLEHLHHRNVWGSNLGIGYWAGCGSTAALLEQLPLLVDLAAHENAMVAVVAAQCSALLASSFPEPAAAFLLSTEGATLLGTLALASKHQCAFSKLRGYLPRMAPYTCRPTVWTFAHENKVADNVCPAR